MIWPWTKIRALEERVEHLRDLADALEDAHRTADTRAEELSRLLAAERERCDRLVQQIVELRREGFHPAPPSSAPPPADDLPPEVRSAIEERAGRDAKLAGALEAQARADLARGARPEEAAKGILVGGEYDPW